MAQLHDLDIDSVGTIALMFLDGDLLENVLLDRYGHTDYDFGRFNALKKTLIRVEKLNPALDLTAVLWQARPDNPEFALPLVCGNALPAEGWQGCRPNEGLMSAFSGRCAAKDRGAFSSHYFPVRNSDGETVGALELLCGSREKEDI